MRQELLRTVCAFSLIAGGLISAVPAAAQEQSEQRGSISGIVTAGDGQSPLAGATVHIPSLGRQAVTDSEGRFRFAQVPAGSYDVEVARFGSPAFAGSVTVTAGGNSDLDLRAPVAVAGNGNDEIVVTGFRANLNSSRARERTSDQYKSVIAADAVGEFGDQNIAEALGRVPAVTISRSEGEGQFVSVRGLSPGFAQVTLNGAEIGGDGDSRGVNLQTIGTNLLESIEVTKTLTPDIAASATAGQINILSASAFRAGKNTLSVFVEGSLQDDAGKVSPKVGFSGTYLTGLFGGDDNFGIAASGNYYNRFINGNEYRNDDGLKRFTDRQGETVYMPGEIDNRREVGSRERFNINLGFEFRPTSQDEFAIRGTYARVNDYDLKLREEWELDLANNVAETVDVAPGSFILADQDKSTDMWLQEIVQKTWTADFEGKHTRGPWQLNYQVSASESRNDRAGSARIQWEEQDAMVRGTFSRWDAYVEGIPRAEALTFPGVPTNARRGDITDLTQHAWVRAWFDDSLGGDKVKTARIDLRRDTALGDNISGFFKVGGLIVDREVDSDENRPQFNPSNALFQQRICGTDSECLSYLRSNITNFGPIGLAPSSILLMPLPQWKNVEPLIERARPLVPIALAGDNLVDNSTADYTASERVTSGYAMGNFDIGGRVAVIGGVRMEHTKYEGTGFLSVTNDDYRLPGQNLGSDIIEPLPVAKNTYTDWFPSLTVNFRPTNNWVIRGSVSRSTKRPTFREAVNAAELTTDLIFYDPVTGAEVTQAQIDAGEYTFDELGLDLRGAFAIGNPNLKPLISTNFDASVSWYPSRNTSITLAAYYKDIKDFIASVRLTDVTFDELPVDLPQSDAFQFNGSQVVQSAGIFLNGESATVKGIEFAFSHVFDNGFFIDANAALIDSTAKLSQLRSDKLPLIGQAKNTANVSVGFENEMVTIRLAGNHKGKELIRIAGSDAERRNDVYSVPFTTLDFNARMNFNRNLQMYMDIINLTGSREIREWQGDESLGAGPAYYIIEDYGTTFQLGVRYRF